ncbi:hypothetical protein [Magnetofaba australis]|uniref:Putative polysaccharide deacetylase n=1 Tax=Magnetofaba australis IT-1 TaxID=1434232 RepID=A0A1Y2K0G3_9PROT|nr:hypothetical protein [Magnetofaba australis]OSM01520.1 putative polysaccharide deacetylase [Magnetofaba australis IT-1]
MKVVLSVDVESWPLDWRADAAQWLQDVERCVWGRGVSGEPVGLGFQLARLAHYGLTAVFFVEPLFAERVGLDALRRIVDAIQAGGHEVQLHPHTEWLEPVRQARLAQPGEFVRGCRLHHFSATEQGEILDRGLALLRDAGAAPVTAFRAGSFGADDHTLTLLAARGVGVDSSLDQAYLGRDCVVSAPPDARAPFVHPSGVIEAPVNGFEDRPGHWRHLQLTACSAGEMTAMLDQAQRSGWRWVMTLSHSFELMNGMRTRVDPLMLRRFDQVCAFLARHRERMHTVGFAQLQTEDWAHQPPPLRSHRGRTAWRMVEQAARRLWRG